MEAAPSYRDLLDDPLGRYAFADRFAGWALHRELAGFTVWGRPTVDDADMLFLPFDREPPATIAIPCDVVFDVRRVHGIDPDAFEHFLRGALSRRAVYHQRIRRQAVVRPSGLIGAAAEGMANLISPAYGWRVCESLHEGLEWLGVPDAAAVASALDELVDGSLAGSPLVARVRTWLEARGGQATIEETARALSLSVRTLQRSLGDAGTSFRQETDRVRLARSRQLLLETELKLEAIAAKVGCANLGTFSSFFRRMTGESPSAFRAKRR